MVCTNCGTGVPDGYRFCPRCGSPVTEVANPAQTQVPPTQPPLMYPQYQATQQPIVQKRSQTHASGYRAKISAIAIIISICLLISPFLPWYSVPNSLYGSGKEGWMGADATNWAFLLSLFALIALTMTFIGLISKKLSAYPLLVGFSLVGMGVISTALVSIKMFSKPVYSMMGGQSLAYGIFGALAMSIGLLVCGVLLCIQK